MDVVKSYQAERLPENVFRVTLEKPAFYFGEIVRGHIILHEGLAIVAQSVIVCLRGAIVKKVQGNRKLVTSILDLKTELPLASQVKLTFQFQLPEQGELLSSVEMDFAAVRYWIDAKLNKSAPKSKAAIGYCLVVLFDIIDCNCQLCSSQGMIAQRNDCCTKPSVRFSFSLDRLVFMPGDTVTAKCEGITAPGRHYLQLKQTIREFGTEGDDRLQERIVKTFNLISPVHSANVGLEKCSSSFQVQGVIPAKKELYPDLRCSLFEVAYTIKLCCDVGGESLHSDDIAVSLGTVPFSTASATTNQPNSRRKLTPEIAAQLNKAYIRIPQLPKLAHFPSDFSNLYYAELIKLVDSL